MPEDADVGQELPIPKSGSPLDLIIVGGGPAGLAAAIAAAQAGLEYRVIEKGMLVNSIFHFPAHMTFFTSPELLEIGGIPFTTPYQKPTREEALRYYRRVADHFRLKIVFDAAVCSIGRVAGNGNRPSFRITTRSKVGDALRIYRSHAVILATGYYDHPNLLGVPGEDLPHVSHYYRDAHGFFRKSVVVVGGNNSAAIAALEIFRAGGRVTLVHRGDGLGAAIKYWVRPDIENRIKEASIAAWFNAGVVAIVPGSVRIESGGQFKEIPADHVLLMTGYHPEVEFLRLTGIRINDQTLVPEHDQSSFETNVPGLYVAGALVAGQETNRIFIENGRFHGEAIVKHLRTRLNEAMTDNQQKFEST